MLSLSELRERRAYECRLTPDRALDSLDDAAAFVRDRGMLTRTTDCALPGLHEACHEEPYKPGGRGFAEWPRTKWPWGFELGRRGDVYAVKIHRGKTLFLSEAAAAFADPICRAEIERLEAADEGSAAVLRHLGNMGPSLVEDVQLELGLKPKELKAIRTPLVRCGAVVARGVVLAASSFAGRPASMRPGKGTESPRSRYSNARKATSDGACRDKDRCSASAPANCSDNRAVLLSSSASDASAAPTSERVLPVSVSGGCSPPPANRR